MGFKRTITRSIAVMALVVAGMTGATSAQAVETMAGCSGTLIRHDPIGSKPYGYVDIYYNSSTGNNCARTVATGTYWGKAKYMMVELYVTDESNGCRSKSVGCRDKDAGTFKYYAGPVTVYGRNSCIYWAARIYTVSTGGVGHCG